MVVSGGHCLKRVLTNLVQQDAAPHVCQRDERHNDERTHEITLRPCFQNEFLRVAGLGYDLTLIPFALDVGYGTHGVGRIFEGRFRKPGRMPRKRAVMSQREKLQIRSQHFYHGRREGERQRWVYEERRGMSTRTNGRSWAFLVARQFSASRHDIYGRWSSWRLRGPSPCVMVLCLREA